MEGGPSALGGGGHKPGGERVEARLRSQERTPGWDSQGPPSTLVGAPAGPAAAPLPRGKQVQPRGVLRAGTGIHIFGLPVLIFPTSFFLNLTQVHS